MAISGKEGSGYLQVTLDGPDMTFKGDTSDRLPDRPAAGDVSPCAAKCVIVACGGAVYLAKSPEGGGYLLVVLLQQADPACAGISEAAPGTGSSEADA